MKTYLLSILILLSAIMFTSCDNRQPSNVIELSGTWYEMGRQYGEKANPYLKDAWTFIQEKIGGDVQRDSAYRDVAGKLVSQYPDKYRDFFKGVSETSDFNLEQVLMINALEYAEGVWLCSGCAAWGDYAAGPLVYGRSYDGMSYHSLHDDVVVTVFHPSDSDISAAIIGYPGQLYATTGINSEGIFLELNNGMPSTGFDVDFSIPASTTKLFDVLFEARTMDDMDAFFHGTKSFAGFLIGVSDGKTARCYEWCPAGVKVGSTDTPDGLMVMVNHYVNPEWEYPVPADENCWNSLTRRANILALAEKNKGRFDVGTMCELMFTPIEEGGPRFAPTLYQIVTVPSEKTLLLRTPFDSEWQSIKLFR